MEKKREKKAPTPQPCEAPRTFPRAAHHVGENLTPGGMAEGEAGAKQGWAPESMAAQWSSHTSNSHRKGAHVVNEQIRPSNQPPRHPDTFPRRERRTQRHAGNMLGVSTISLWHQRQARARHQPASALHGPRRRETSRRISELRVWYGRLTHTSAKSAGLGGVSQETTTSASSNWLGEASAISWLLLRTGKLPRVARVRRHGAGQICQPECVVGSLRHISLFPSRDATLGNAALFRNLGLRQSSLAKGLDVFGGFAHADIMHICVIRQSEFALFVGA